MQTEALRWVVLGLVAGHDAGIHGYQLKQEFDARYGDVWSLAYGQMYRTLDRLAQLGFVAATDQLQVGRPNRKVFRVTDRGRRRLERWLLRPPAPEPPPLRDELGARLLFLPPARVGEAIALVRSQRSLHLQQLARLDRRRAALAHAGDDAFANRLVLQQADMRLRTDLAWLDVVEAEVQQRATPQPARVAP